MGTPTPPPSKHAARNARWAALRASGVPWRKIAQREGVSLSTVQRGVADHERALDVTVDAARDLAAGLPVARAGLADVQHVSQIPVEELFLMIVGTHVDAIDRLDVLARTADHEGAKVGAAKARLQAARSLADVLAMVGLLPNANNVLMLRAEQQPARAHARLRGEALLAGAGR
jgi:hypothetical protein